MAKLMYVAAPIFGLPKVFVERKFVKGSNLATRAGYIPIIPTDIEPRPHAGDCPAGRPSPFGHNDTCHLHADLVELLKCQAILMMEGWSASWGAKLELQVAGAVGLKVAFQTNTTHDGLMWVQ